MASDRRDTQPQLLVDSLQRELASAELAGPLPPSTVPQGLGSIWYGLAVRPWTTLAVVAPDDAQKSWRLARAMVEVAGQTPQTLKAVNVLDASVERAAAITHAVFPKKTKAPSERMRMILAVDSPLRNPVSLGLLTSCDAVLIVLERGTSKLPDARRILELVGHDRFIGAVFVI
jgi:hypothetical protein